MVPPTDPTALAEAIGRLVQDPELRKRQGDAGRERVEESFSREEVAGELIARFEACALDTGATSGIEEARKGVFGAETETTPERHAADSERIWGVRPIRSRMRT